jgi:hypothetical protein
MNLLKYHSNYEEKVYNFKYFIVDTYYEKFRSRCFFVVRNNDTKLDFSRVKCMKNLKKKFREFRLYNKI